MGHPVRVLTDANGNYITVTERLQGWSVMIDNLGSPAVDATNHQFAAIWVPRDKRNDFVKLFADAMGTPVKFADVPAKPADPEPAIKVYDNADQDWWETDRGDSKRYMVMGDVIELLDNAEYTAMEKYYNDLHLPDDGGWTPNYWVVHLWQKDVPAMFFEALDYEPEGMCFFAYTDDKWFADQLAEYLNTKVFMRRIS